MHVMDQSAIQRRLELLEKSEGEYKTKKEILQDSLKSDEEMIALDDKAKDAKTRMAAHKAALLNEPDKRKLVADLKDLSQEIKDTKQLLGDELITYFMENNTLEYTDASGMKRRFAVSAKFLKGKGEQ
jgi:hypothetical protein